MNKQHELPSLSSSSSSSSDGERKGHHHHHKRGHQRRAPSTSSPSEEEEERVYAPRSHAARKQVDAPQQGYESPFSSDSDTLRSKRRDRPSGTASANEDAEENYKVNIPYDEILYLLHDTLGHMGLYGTLRTLEKESQKTFVNYNEDALFLRSLVLDGKFDEAQEFLEPILSRLSKKRQKEVLRTIGIQQFLEMFVGETMDASVQALIDNLKCLELICSKDEFNELCYILTLEDLRDHPSYQDWSVSMGRDDCFRTLVPFLEECLGDISCSQNASLTNPSGVLFGILGSRARNADKMSNAGHTLIYHPVTDQIGSLDGRVFSASANSEVRSNITRDPSSVFSEVLREDPADLMQNQLILKKQERVEQSSDFRVEVETTTKPNEKAASKNTNSRPRTAGDDLYQRYVKDPQRNGQEESSVVAKLGGREATEEESQDIQDILRRSLDPTKLRSLKGDATKENTGPKQTNLNESETEEQDEENKKAPVAWEIPFFENAKVKETKQTPQESKTARENQSELGPQKPTRHFHPTDLRRMRRVKEQRRPQTAPSSRDHVQDNAPVRVPPAPAPAESRVENRERPKSMETKAMSGRVTVEADRTNEEDAQGLLTPTSESSDNSQNNQQSTVERQQEPVEERYEQPATTECAPQSSPHWRWSDGVHASLSFSPASSFSDVSPIRTIDFDGSGSFLAIGSNSKYLRIGQVASEMFDAASYMEARSDYRNYESLRAPEQEEEKISILESYRDFHLGSVYSIDWSNHRGNTIANSDTMNISQGDTALIATGSNDTVVKLLRWEYGGTNYGGNGLAGQTLGEPQFKRPEAGTVRKVQFLTKDCLATAGSGQGAICLFDVEASGSEPTHRFYGHSGVVFSLQKWGHANQNNVFLSGGSDATVRLWDLRTGTTPIMETQLNSPSGVNPEVHSLAANNYTMEQQIFAAGCGDGTVRVFDLRNASREAINSSSLHASECRSVEFSPDGNLLLSGSFDNSFAVWDVTNSSDVSGGLKVVHHQRNAHEDKVLQVKWHPICPAIATSGADKMVRLWQATYC